MFSIMQLVNQSYNNQSYMIGVCVFVMRGCVCVCVCMYHEGVCVFVCDEGVCVFVMRVCVFVCDEGVCVCVSL